MAQRVFPQLRMMNWGGPAGSMSTDLDSPSTRSAAGRKPGNVIRHSARHGYNE